MLGDCEGPHIGELLARLIEGIGKVDQRVRRILARLEATGLDLPANIVMRLSEERGRFEGNAS